MVLKYFSRSSWGCSNPGSGPPDLPSPFGTRRRQPEQDPANRGSAEAARCCDWLTSTSQWWRIVPAETTLLLGPSLSSSSADAPGTCPRPFGCWSWRWRPCAHCGCTTSAVEEGQQHLLCATGVDLGLDGLSQPFLFHCSDCSRACGGTPWPRLWWQYCSTLPCSSG